MYKEFLLTSFKMFMYKRISSLKEWHFGFLYREITLTPYKK